MELQKIRYFLALAESLNFTRAAEDCHVSQPALTRAIKTLEDEFGGALIRREGRLSHLTELGQRVLPVLRQCYDSALSAKALAKSIHEGDTTSLSLAIGRTVNLDLLLDQFRELHDTFPKIQLKLKRGSSAEICELLKSGDVELALGGPLSETWDRLDSWPMFTEAFDFVVGDDHALVAHSDMSLDVEFVRGARFLVNSSEEISEGQINRLREAGVDIATAHEIEADSDVEALVVANVGVAIAPRSSLNSKRVRHIPYQALHLRRTLAVYTVAGRPRSREAAAFINLIRSADWSQKFALSAEL
jgi:DNA-binding transcriptional LysR family regulator